MTADLTIAKRALLALLGGSWPAPALTDATWPAVAEMAATHRLEPMLAWQAERHGWPLPEAVAATWRSARRAAALAALAHQAGLRLALDRLDAAGIAAVALKGVPLAWRHYPEPGLRPMRDIDLLVRVDRAREAAAILASAGFVPDADDPRSLAAALADGHQLPAQQHSGLGVTIELHHRLSDPPQGHGYRVPQLDPEAMMASAVMLDCGGFAVRCPAPQDLAAHVVVHALYGHRLDCGPLILADLHFLAFEPAIDWARLRQVARGDGWLRGADLLLALTERWFGGVPAGFAAPPVEVLAAAENALVPAPATRAHASALADIGAARSAAAVARVLARRLGPDPDVVAREAGGAPMWAFWPMWAARRIARLSRAVASRRVAGEARHAAQVMRWVQR